MSEATASAADFDIDAIEDLESAEIQLKDDGGKPLPIHVTLLGPEHPKRKNFALDRQRRMRRAMQRTGRMEFADPADEAVEDLDNLVACVAGWRGITRGGKPVACDPAAVRELLTDVKRAWFRRAVERAFGDIENFTRRSGGA